MLKTRNSGFSAPRLKVSNRIRKLMEKKMAKARNYLNFASKFFRKENSMPIYLVFFITERCIAHCKHCLLGERRRGLKELNLDEIEKISRSMGPLLFLLPTGGEPFIRKDIADIVSIFYKNNQTANVGIPTNGFYTERTLISAERILTECPNVDLAIDVSFDGVGEKHNIIRGVPKLFEHAVTTFRELEKLKKRFPRFNLNVGVTVSKYNQYDLDELYEFLTGELGVVTINHLLVRGNPSDKDARDVEPDIYQKFSRKLEEGAKNATLKGYHNYSFSDFVNSVRIVRQGVINDLIRTDEQQLPCYAGALGAVLLSDGGLYPCELLDKEIGNLREFNYDFAELWFGERKREIRKWIKETKCHCTYECFLTLSVFFTPSSLIKVFQEYSSLKLNRLMHNHHQNKQISE